MIVDFLLLLHMQKSKKRSFAERFVKKEIRVIIRKVLKQLFKMNSYSGCHNLQNLDRYNVDIPNMQGFFNHELRFLNEEIFGAGTTCKYNMYL